LYGVRIISGLLSFTKLFISSSFSPELNMNLQMFVFFIDFTSLRYYTILLIKIQEKITYLNNIVENFYRFFENI